MMLWDQIKDPSPQVEDRFSLHRWYFSFLGTLKHLIGTAVLFHTCSGDAEINCWLVDQVGDPCLCSDLERWGCKISLLGLTLTHIHAHTYTHLMGSTNYQQVIFNSIIHTNQPTVCSSDGWWLSWMECLPKQKTKIDWHELWKEDFS